jgi:hypothetical protein
MLGAPELATAGLHRSVHPEFATVIAIDVGDQGNLKVATGKLHVVLTDYGIEHDFEIDPGTHTS